MDLDHRSFQVQLEACEAEVEQLEAERDALAARVKRYEAFVAADDAWHVAFLNQMLFQIPILIQVRDERDATRAAIEQEALPDGWNSEALGDYFDQKQTAARAAIDAGDGQG